MAVPDREVSAGTVKAAVADLVFVRVRRGHVPICPPSKGFIDRPKPRESRAHE